MPGDLPAIFRQLSAILRARAGKLTIATDTPTLFCLYGGKHPTHKAPMPIAWTEINKNYVSYHLMPVYRYPTLLQTISPALRARMHGKACFNFKAPDKVLFQELDRLTVAGLAAFKKAATYPDSSGKSPKKNKKQTAQT